jgi:hypothetical protein
VTRAEEQRAHLASASTAGAESFIVIKMLL